MRKIYFLFISLLVLACQENNTPDIDPNNLLLGSWGNAEYDNGRFSFKRINSLPDDAYAISFLPDFTYVERTSGWCGTPPLTFFNIDGSWLQEGSILSIVTNGYIGSYEWEIISLNETDLVVEYHLSQQEQEHRALMDLFDEIYSIANSITCTDASDWNYTPYGSKACGGPQGYIAYSNQIDVPAFLTLVDSYTQAEHFYNIQWGIVSTCDVTPQPMSVSCESGSAVLNY